MADETTFDLTLERIALIRRMVVAWNGTEIGAPIIHPDAPYGSTDRDGDIYNVTGEDEGAEEEHRALGDALAVFVQNATLKPGRYQYHNPLAKLSFAKVSDLFRNEATGETPAQISFEVTPEHLQLLQKLSLGWDDEAGVPAVNPRKPYGDISGLAMDMAGDLDEPAEDRLSKLHREMQPALQIFLRYADLGPGTFRQSGRTGNWEPA